MYIRICIDSYIHTHTQTARVMRRGGKGEARARCLHANACGHFGSIALCFKRGIQLRSSSRVCGVVDLQFQKKNFGLKHTQILRRPNLPGTTDYTRALVVSLYQS